jgi:hypothetical protein
MTFVMYPKADSSRIVKRQGKNPCEPVAGFDPPTEHLQILEMQHFSPGLRILEWS